MSNSEKPFYIAQNLGFSQIEPRDELLHPQINAGITADSATETQYLGFSVPEERIHALCYLWHHPNLKVVTGGLYVWQGIKRYMPAAELCDVRTFMSDRALANDLHEYRLDNGYGVRVVQPLQKLHMSYRDDFRKNSVDLTYEALAPPVMFGDGKHFEQPMRVRGDLILRGNRYEVDCFNVRDRSWGKARPEDNMPLPPVSWMTGVFGDDFAFNCNVLDQHAENAELKGRFELPRDKTFNGGWVRRDGVVSRITTARKRVERETGTKLPRAVELEFTDEHNRTLTIRGSLLAACPWQVWSNMIFMVCLMRWECGGRVTNGDCQEAYWNDYLNHTTDG
ncbi:DUF7064 domain-containing protein [Hydrocarboniphaga sp.]|uniref:DUF7064 domain-containing protein n=1 Tax=Hydrocarboniphaga sp. TaxID=2033016 RepID=UPI003D103650